MNAKSTFSRVSVIDHRTGGEGLVLEVWGALITVDVQDQGRTLKVFIDDAPKEEKD